MMAENIHVLVTSAAGHTAFPLMYQLANGDVFGQHQPIILNMLEVSSKLNKLKGIAMELMDCAMENLIDVMPTMDLLKAFKDVDVAFLLTLQPKDIVEAKELFATNISDFKSYGEALELFAKRTVKVVVMGQSCNTNAMICSRYAPSIPVRNFSSLSRLVENQARGQVAARLKLTANCVHNVIIWGDSSKTYYPDLCHATVDYPKQLRQVIGIYEAVKNEVWLKRDFIQLLQKYSGDAIFNSFAAAQAAVEHVRDWWYGTSALNWVSMGVVSDGSYGVPRGIIFSFPVFIHDRQWRIAKDLHIDTFSELKLKKVIQDLMEEHQKAVIICDENWGPPIFIPKSTVDQVLAQLESEKKSSTVKTNTPLASQKKKSRK